MFQKKHFDPSEPGPLIHLDNRSSVKVNVSLKWLNDLSWFENDVFCQMGWLGFSKNFT